MQLALISAENLPLAGRLTRHHRTVAERDHDKLILSILITASQIVTVSKKSDVTYHRA